MIMDILKDIVTIGLATSIGLTLLGRFLPNSKVYMGGFNLGVMLTVFGTSKLGAGWEKVETFFTDSLGHFFNGFRDGLNSDDIEGSTPNPPKDKKKNARI